MGADFESLASDLMHAEDDLNYAQCKLDGSWPGWEWIVEAKVKNKSK